MDRRDEEMIDRAMGIARTYGVPVTRNPYTGGVRLSAIAEPADPGAGAPPPKDPKDPAAPKDAPSSDGEGRKIADRVMKALETAEDAMLEAPEIADLLVKLDAALSKSVSRERRAVLDRFRAMRASPTAARNQRLIDQANQPARARYASPENLANYRASRAAEHLQELLDEGGDDLCARLLERCKLDGAA